MQHLRERTRVVARVGRELRQGHVASLGDELRKALVRDGKLIDPEAFNTNAIRWTLLYIMSVGADHELAGRNPHHVRCGQRVRWLNVDDCSLEDLRPNDCHSTPPIVESGARAP